MTVRFRGRELTHPEIGRALLTKFGEAVKDHGTVDRTPALEGKSMFMTLVSVHKPRVHEHRNPATKDRRRQRGAPGPGHGAGRNLVRSPGRRPGRCPVRAAIARSAPPAAEAAPAGE